MFTQYRIDFQDGLEGWISVELVYSGCNRAIGGNPCPGCHNEWLWPHFAGTFVCRRKFDEWLGKLARTGWKPSGIVVTGGEPLDQDAKEVLFDIDMVKKAFGTKLPILVYTGYEWDEGLLDHPLVKVADYLKCGPYKPDVPKKLVKAGDRHDDR